MAARQALSFVWQYFERQNEGEAKCLECQKIISCKGWSISGLSRHLQKKHNIFEKKNEDEEQSCQKQKLEPGFSAFFKKEFVSLEEIVSKLAAQDGISIHAICNSKFIRSALLDKGLKLPKYE